ncbi:uncharacterized protein EDB93DRAFT_1162592 [Suillus bovinus]|uniref:uncharacterized protein n=1 Tax=Suillus bovinus TaxID=48563 RepID=UPI001B860E10|nr:uncharacterized protein EDB93DRAFT_1162592 [Suillus bovinus]KAG2139819.1 hypothetical protein EDB93DRAFT_1162592 [Suillus bovinus]
MAQLGEQQKQLAQSLADLHSVIAELPGSLPEAAEDGPIGHHLRDFSVDEDEGPFYSFNRAWERVFQHSENERQKLVMRGRHGVILAHDFAVHFAALPNIEQHDGLVLMNERIKALIKLLHDVYVISCILLTIIAKEWLKRDFGNGVNFLEGVNIH